MKICQNIDLVQIKVQSNRSQSDSHGLTYYFPKSVSWANEVVQKIVVAAPTGGHLPSSQTKVYRYPKSPIDGSYIYNQKDYTQTVIDHLEATGQQGIYFDIYRKDGSALTKDLSVLSLLSTNNQVFEINAKLDLEQTCIHIPGKLANDGVIWIYVFYGGHDDPAWEYPKENITVQIPLAAMQRMSFADIINNYVHIQPNRIRGIYVWNINTPSISDGRVTQLAGSQSAVCLTLRDFNQTYIVRSVIDEVIGMHGSRALKEIYAPKRNHLYFDHDIDFDNSFIENLYEELATTATIIFEY